MIGRKFARKTSYAWLCRTRTSVAFSFTNCARRAYARGLSWDFAIRVAVISGPTAMSAVVRAPVQVYGPRDASAACRAIRIAYLAAQQVPDLLPDGDRIEVLLPSKDAIVETEYRIPGTSNKT